MNSFVTMTLISMVSLATVPAARATECLLPQAPSKIPDGSTATGPEMRTAMETITQYKGDVDTYLKCLEFERKQGHMSEGQESTLHNSALDTLQAIANKFNAQVRTFKARSG